VIHSEQIIGEIVIYLLQLKKESKTTVSCDNHRSAPPLQYGNPHRLATSLSLLARPLHLDSSPSPLPGPPIATPASTQLPATPRSRATSSLPLPEVAPPPLVPTVPPVPGNSRSALAGSDSRARSAFPIATRSTPPSSRLRYLTLCRATTGAPARANPSEATRASGFHVSTFLANLILPSFLIVSNK